ncbi:hypothetical protein V6N12_055489 [Hibiscus sabdariffa]|uniref:Uncharacterized protein n=1 Tax=Hibiscus sabdariffa TaxID=183260 RepID=A0ABR2BU06_9ROSI
MQRNNSLKQKVKELKRKRVHKTIWVFLFWEFMRRPFNCCLSVMLECSETELLLGAACIVEPKAICSSTEPTPCFLCTMSGKLKAAMLGINC